MDINGSNNPIFNVGGFILEQTCEFCPEQYDVYKYKRQVGYIRLKYGRMRVFYPNNEGELIYEVATQGEHHFWSKTEREHCLKMAVLTIRDAIERNRKNRMD